MADPCIRLEYGDADSQYPTAVFVREQRYALEELRWDNAYDPGGAWGDPFRFSYGRRHELVLTLREHYEPPKPKRVKRTDADLRLRRPQ